MKRLLFLLFLCVSNLAAQQAVPSTYVPQLISFPGVPFGVCDIYQIGLNNSNGQYYSCTPGTRAWTAIGGSGGSGAFGPNYSVGGGTAQAQTVAPTTADTNALLVNGYSICWLPNAANTGAAPTLAGSGTSTFSAKPITKYGTIPLIANDIVTSAIACAVYDGTEFQLQMPKAGAIYTTSVQSVGASAQAMNLYVSGGCDGVSACTGNFWGIQAPASLAASLQYTPNLTDGSGNAAWVTNGSQALSFVQLPQYIAGAGAVNVMTATYVPAFSALAAGEEFDVLPNLANTTTTPTFNVNGLGAKTATKCGTSALVAGDWSTTAVAMFIYDGTGMQLQNPQTGPCYPILAPNGTAGAPSYSFSNRANSGWFNDTGNGGWGWSFNASEQALLGFNLVMVPGFAFQWTPTNLAASPDVGISRDSIGIFDVDTTAPGNAAGFIRSGNTVRLTSNFTTASLSLVTITGLSWTFPATNHNYSFHCSLSYSQATAAAANAFGVQAATTAPTNLYAAMQVSTGLAVTGVDATLPTLTTTTATNIGTFTPSAAGAIGNVPTIFTGELWGSLEQGAGATTLNIMTLTGNASDSLTIYRGSACFLEP